MAKAVCHKRAGFSHFEPIVTVNGTFQQSDWTKTSRSVRIMQFHFIDSINAKIMANKHKIIIMGNKNMNILRECTYHETRIFACFENAVSSPFTTSECCANYKQACRLYVKRDATLAKPKLTKCVLVLRVRNSQGKKYSGGVRFPWEINKKVRIEKAGRTKKWLRRNGRWGHRVWS